MKAAVDDEANFENPDRRGPEPAPEEPEDHEVTEATASPARGAASPTRAAIRAHASPGKHQNSATRPTKQGLRQLQAAADRRDAARSEARVLVEELGKQLKPSIGRLAKAISNKEAQGQH